MKIGKCLGLFLLIVCASCDVRSGNVSNKSGPFDGAKGLWLIEYKKNGATGNITGKMCLSEADGYLINRVGLSPMNSCESKIQSKITNNFEIRDICRGVGGKKVYVTSNLKWTDTDHFKRISEESYEGQLDKIESNLTGSRIGNCPIGYVSGDLIVNGIRLNMHKIDQDF